MPYTNCSACGAKALVGATRCPRCQAPVVSYDIKGERVRTVNCPNCGVQRPVAIGVCPNCLMSTAPSGQRLRRGLTLTGLAIVAILTVGYLMSRRTERMKATPAATEIVPALIAPSATASATASPASQSPPPAVAATSAPLTPEPPRPAKRPTVAVPEAGSWEYALATTWVRVRSAPTRESEVLRMVDSAQRVRLGPPLNGWRSIQVGVDRGWVDPRYFTIVSAPRP